METRTRITAGLLEEVAVCQRVGDRAGAGVAARRLVAAIQEERLNRRTGNMCELRKSDRWALEYLRELLERPGA